jgi:hypothetical protein
MQRCPATLVNQSTLNEKIFDLEPDIRNEDTSRCFFRLKPQMRVGKTKVAIGAADNHCNESEHEGRKNSP